MEGKNLVRSDEEVQYQIEDWTTVGWPADIDQFEKTGDGKEL